MLPTGDPDDALLAIKQTPDLSPISRPASAATTYLGPGRDMGAVAGDNKHRQSLIQGLDRFDAFDDLLTSSMGARVPMRLSVSWSNGLKG